MTDLTRVEQLLRDLDEELAEAWPDRWSPSRVQCRLRHVLALFAPDEADQNPTQGDL